MQILIVEDEEKIANFLRRGLIEDRYAADIAPDGEEALYKYDINEYDLIILDLMIPKVDGLTVCRKIRSNNSNIPILMLTARDNIENQAVTSDNQNAQEVNGAAEANESAGEKEQGENLPDGVHQDQDNVNVDHQFEGVE